MELTIRADSAHDLAMRVRELKRTIESTKRATERHSALACDRDQEDE